ncbi:hypothetical protein CEXT_457791 [Caerostris extrusa]|uniref:Uncharacterized protein n=1 Tax=Caerostris extrusa TaxID=172846 RepID=A0AAV4P3C0_CAEEX|nr:hypothetical protein CEXT_457791 [Caerostris extrusa]
MTIQAHCAGPFSGGILSFDFGPLWSFRNARPLHLHISSDLIGRGRTLGLLFSFGATRLCRNLNFNPLDLRWLLNFLVNAHADSKLLYRRNEFDLSEDFRRNYQTHFYFKTARMYGIEERAKCSKVAYEMFRN